MKKNGFTLIELIGSIAILAIISLIAFPAIIGVLNKEQKNVSAALQDTMVSAANSYVNDHISDYPKNTSTDESARKTYSTNVTYSMLESGGYIDPSIGEKNCEIKNDEIKVTSNYKKYFYEYVSKDGGCD